MSPSRKGMVEPIHGCRSYGSSQKVQTRNPGGGVPKSEVNPTFRAYPSTSLARPHNQKIQTSPNSTPAGNQAVKSLSQEGTFYIQTLTVAMSVSST